MTATAPTQAPVRIDDLTPGGHDWLKVMSASKVAAMLGLSPWESPYSLWHKMAGNLDPEPQTEVQERGHYLEPVVAEWFADQHPDLVLEPGGTWHATDRPWQVASPDRLIFDAEDGTRPVALLECKTAAARDWEWGTPGTDEIPIEYRCQIMWQLDTLGLDVAHVAVLTAYLEFREYVVHYSAEEADYLRDQATAFLASIDAGAEPALDDTDHTYQALRRLHPDIEDVDIELDQELASEWLTANAEAKRAEAVLVGMKSRVAQAMGTARRAVYGTTTYAVRQSRKRGDGTPGTPFVVIGRGLLPKEEVNAA